jgi:thioredoxin reductase
MTETYDVIIIGGGPAGMAAAIGAAEGGLKKILIIERHGESGGILNQCIHNGFGLHRFGENLTGPEYALNYLNILPSYVEVKLNTMVLSINGQHEVCCLSSGEGLQTLYSKSIILAMGCRERSRGAVNIPGTRPAGVFTAGTAQMYVNIYGLSVGRRVVIRGTGDIGLIMARRLTLEGAEVLACIGAGDHAEGLQRNVAQCLDDFNIPLLLRHTVTEVRGSKRVEQVVAMQVDEKRRIIPGTEKIFDCDTLLLSIGLIPENELSHAAGVVIDPKTRGAVVYDNMETSVPGIFACGNVLHVHDLVDFVSEESESAASAPPGMSSRVPTRPCMGYRKRRWRFLRDPPKGSPCDHG